MRVRGGEEFVGNRVLRNAIFANADLGIDVGDDGPNPNDPGEADTGTNNLQNAPVIDSAATTGGATTIRGTLNSAANATCVLRFYANPRAATSARRSSGS